MFTQNEDFKIIARNINNDTCSMLFSVENIDTDDPVIEYTETAFDEVGNGLTISVVAQDGHSGIKEYSFDGGTTWQDGNAMELSTNPSAPNVRVRDHAGNQTDVYTLYITVSQNPSTWTTGNVTVTLQAGSGTVSTYEYSFNGGVTWQPTNFKTYTDYQENVEMAVRETTMGGQSGMVTIPQILVDRDMPELELSVSVISVEFPTINVLASDNQSGLAVVKWAEGTKAASYFSNGGTALSFQDDENYFLGVYDAVYTAYAKDVCGNEVVKTIVADESEELPENLDPVLSSGNTSHPIYGKFDYLVSNETLAEYFIVSMQTPILFHIPEWEENQEEPGELPDYMALLRENAGEWVGQVTLENKTPLMDANDCEVENAYNFTYQTEDPEGIPETVHGYIIVSSHTGDIMSRIVLDETFDGQHFNAGNQYYYFTELETSEYNLFSKSQSDQYFDCLSVSALTETAFQAAKENSFTELESRDRSLVGELSTDNKEEIKGIYNMTVIADGGLEEEYGLFDWTMNHETMAQYLLEKELSTGTISYADLENIIMTDDVELYDENDVAFGRAYNFLHEDGADGEHGYILMSTHTDQPLLLEYQLDAQLPVGYEKTYFIDETVYFYDGQEYYDLEENLLDYDPLEQTGVRMASGTRLTPTRTVGDDPLELLEELDEIIEEYMEEEQGEFPEEPFGGFGIMATSATTITWPTIKKGSADSQLTYAFKCLLLNKGYKVTKNTTFDTAMEDKVKAFQKTIV